MIDQSHVHAALFLAVVIIGAFRCDSTVQCTPRVHNEVNRVFAGFRGVRLCREVAQSTARAVTKLL
jgi:hypothetical protein